MEPWPKTSHDQSLSVPRAGPGVATDGHESRLITVTVKGSADIQEFQVAANSLVEQLKEEVAPHFKAAKDHVLLIFAGKILKDQDTLLQHDIQEGRTVYLVVRKPPLRGQSSLQAPTMGPDGRALSPLDSGCEAPGTASSLQVLLDSSRRDLLALLEVLNEVPAHFQACPELMSEVLQSPTVQSTISGDCSPLAIAFVLAVSTVIGLNTLKPSKGSEKVVGRGQITQALERASVWDILTNTKEMAQFLSESPELRQFAQETPHFSTWMSPSGLSRMVAIYKKLFHLGSTLATEADMSAVGDMLDDVHTFHRLFVDIGKVFSNSEAQEELEDRLLRQVLATHPALQQLAEENPEIGHLLKNPRVVADIVKYIRSPEIRLEIDRHCDRTLSNLESLPGGFAVLRHMYQDFEEPLWKAAHRRQSRQLSLSLAGRGLSPAGGSPIPPGVENRAPLPDPWAPRQEGPVSKPPKSSSSSSSSSSKRNRPEESSSHSPKGALEGPNVVSLHLGSPGRGRCEASLRPAVPDSSPEPGVQAPGSLHSPLPSMQGRPETQAAGSSSEEQEKQASKGKASTGLSVESKGSRQGAPDRPQASKGPP